MILCDLAHDLAERVRERGRARAALRDTLRRVGEREHVHDHAVHIHLEEVINRDAQERPESSTRRNRERGRGCCFRCHVTSLTEL